MKTSYLLGSLIVIVAIMIGVTYYFSAYGNSPSSNVFVQLTDPALVPVGTQQLNLTYSSVSVNFLSNGTNSIATAKGTGTVNLLSLVNYTQVIAGLSVPANATINSISLKVASVSIEINNTIYPVDSVANNLIANITPYAVNGTTSLVMDLAPTIITVYNYTSPVFIMAPSFKAISVPGLANRYKVGEKEKLGANNAEKLRANTPKLSITGASLSVNSNIINLSVSVKDNSNQSTRIKNVMLFGSSPFNFVRNITGINVSSNASIPSIIPTDIAVTNNQSSSSNSNGESEIQKEIGSMRTINFLVTNTSALVLPYLNQNIGNFENEGYTLTAGQTVNLNFYGNLSLSQGVESESSHYRLIKVLLTQNSAYTIVVSGTRDSRAKIQVNAT